MGHEYEPGKFRLKKGALYRIDADGSVHKVASDIDISNGLCWDTNEGAFYYADSFEYTVRRYDYDVNSGEIGKESAFDASTGSTAAPSCIFGRGRCMFA